MTRVLIVDDDGDHAESLADVLEMRGYQAQLASTGEEALALCRSADFDFVLLDVRLPGINGVDTFLEMKKIRPRTRVMMMTGYSVEQLVSQALDGGAIGVLHKPFAALQVLEVLSQVHPRATLLVADDDPAFIDSIVPILEAARYSVQVASSGAEALERVMSQSIDCLILDLRLPVLSGPELYSLLVEAGRTVPTVLVTGCGQEAGQEASRELQTHSILFKPFDPDALLAAVGSAVSPRSAA